MQKHSDDDCICRNCKSALERCNYSFDRYGDYAYGYECLKVIDRTEYVKASNTCPLFERREK